MGPPRRIGFRAIAFMLAVFAAVPGASAQSQSLTVKVVQGDNAINSIRHRRGHDPVVQVIDPSGEPLGNATVSFLLPATGPSATFGDSGLSLTVQTDARGMATGKGLTPNRIEGQFRIRATASWRGEAASATITQTNAEAPGTSNRSKWIALAAVIGGAAVGGIVLASRGGGNEPGGSTGGSTGSSSGTIVPGTPTFGPPR
jgi:hypothetical protein